MSGACERPWDYALVWWNPWRVRQGSQSPGPVTPLPSLGGRVRATAQQILPADTSYAPVFLIYCIHSVWLELDGSIMRDTGL